MGILLKTKFPSKADIDQLVKEELKKIEVKNPTKEEAPKNGKNAEGDEPMEPQAIVML